MPDPRPEPAVPPARPHHRYTDDGRRIREVLTYSRRGSRLTAKQAEAWERDRRRWVVSDDAVERPGFTWATAFDREAPLAVEIGSGVGEATVAIAEANPGWNVLAFEVWRPGLADTLIRIRERGLVNVRLCAVDAVWSIEHTVPADGLAALFTFFPDPWHKARHHKRRLIAPPFARTAAARLAPGGTWRLATDWAEYAEQMVEVFDAEPLLDGGPTPRWEGRPLTKFERKGLAVGREITDLTYTRTLSGA